MERLFVMDARDYTDDMPIIERHTVRAIIKRDGKFAMQQSKTGEYKIPGGGVEGNESEMDTLKREVKEEVGLLVDDDSVKEIGEVLELREDAKDKGNKFVRKTSFYLCNVKSERCAIHMTLSEERKGFKPVWADINTILQTNLRLNQPECDKRDTLFLQWFKDNWEG